MSNFPGPVSLENFFLVLPKDWAVADPSAKWKARKQIGDFEIYQWQDEVPASTNHQVDVTLRMGAALGAGASVDKRAAESRLAAAKATAEAAAEEVKTIQLRVQAGVATQSDLLKAQIALADAQANQAAMEIEVARLQGEPSWQETIARAARARLAALKAKQAMSSDLLALVEKQYNAGFAGFDEAKAAQVGVVEAKLAVAVAQAELAKTAPSATQSDLKAVPPATQPGRP